MGLVKSICEFLGKANKPVYTVMAVAVFKGILRPIFTMMDKEQDPETKKYAAVREGATELTALVTYPLLSWATEKLAPKFSTNGKTIDQLLHSSKSTLGFLGVCFAALFVIPKLCNIAMPHVMKALKMEKPQKDDKPAINPYPTETLFVANSIPQNVNNIRITKEVQYPYAATSTNTSGGMRI